MEEIKFIATDSDSVVRFNLRVYLQVDMIYLHQSIGNLLPYGFDVLRKRCLVDGLLHCCLLSGKRAFAHA